MVVGFFIKDYLSDDLDFSVAIYSDQLCCVTKKALRIPQYLLPTISFQPIVWLLLFLTTLLAGLIWMILRELAMRSNPFEWHFTTNERDVFPFIVNSGIIMLSSPMRKLPKRFVERTFIASLCFVSLIFVSVFQSSLSTAYIKPFYYKDIDTLHDLSESSLQIGIKYPAMMDDLFPPGSTGILQVLREKMVLTNSTSSLMDKIAGEGKIVAVTRKELVMQSYDKHFAGRHVHMISECPRSYNLGFFGPKHSVYMDRVNEVLLQLNNGGFHVKWIRDLHYNYTWITLKKYGTFHEEKFRVLNTGDLLFPSFILFGGMVLSGIVFVGERVLNRWSGGYLG